jgi:DNA gyrase/topoisomerase IV subunit B
MNYQDTMDLIQDAKVVTLALTPLYRVATRNFDYIILDECVSNIPALQQHLPHEQAC